MKKHLQSILLIGISFLLSACQNTPQIQEEKASIDMQRLDSIRIELTKEFRRIDHQVIQPAEGYLKYPYLIPAGFYKQMWDWDGFFMGNHFCSIDKPEYLKYWALNLIEGIDEEGYVSGCATTKGPRPIFGKFAMKPFLSQGVYLASEKMQDFSWVEPHYEALLKVLDYRDKTQMDSITQLYFWDNAMQSGADNNPAMNYFWKEDLRSFLSPDVSTWQLREIIATANIAKELGKIEDHKRLSTRAKELKADINKYLWCEEDQIYYTVDRETGDFYRRVSFSSFIPLVENIAPQAKGAEMIKRYLANEDHMKAKFGFRSLSKQDPDYNNKNIIVPFSNWQGPVWPIANYIYHVGLKNYGFDEEVAWMAETLGLLLLNDIKEWGSMHENFHADTGAPLAPSSDHVDKDGKFVGFISWNLCIQNVMEGSTQDKWMLLELE